MPAFLRSSNHRLFFPSFHLRSSCRVFVALCRASLIMAEQVLPCSTSLLSVVLNTYSVFLYIYIFKFLFSLILQTEKAFLKQPKVFLWYVHSKHCKFDFYIFLSVKFTDSSFDFVIFVVILNFAARRRQRRGTGLGREEIAIGRALAWVSRLLARLLRVCRLCFQTANLFGYCTKFVYIVFTCFDFLFLWTQADLPFCGSFALRWSYLWISSPSLILLLYVFWSCASASCLILLFFPAEIRPLFLICFSYQLQLSSLPENLTLL